MRRTLVGRLLLFWAGILFLFPGPAFAGLEWKDAMNLSFDVPVLDVSEFPNGKFLFILTPEAVLIYSISGEKVEQRIPLDRVYDRLIHSPKNNTLILTSRTEKAVKIVQLEIVHEIDLSGLPFLGAENAPVSLAVFSDYQWSSCARLEPILRQLLEKYPGKVKIVTKNFPLSSHKFARTAAAAALAAGRQGKFEKFNERLFQNHDKLSDVKIQEIAGSTGLDMAQFNKDMQDPAILLLIERDKSEGEQIGIRAVPSLFVNGKFFQRGKDLHEMIEDELEPGR